MTYSEHLIQCAIKEYLDLNNIFYFAIPNGEKRPIKKIYSKKNGCFINICPSGKRLKEEGVKSGVLDMAILAFNEKCIFVEVKTKKGTLSKNQKDFIFESEKRGHKCFVVRSLDDFINLISNLKKSGYIFSKKIDKYIYQDECIIKKNKKSGIWEI